MSERYEGDSWWLRMVDEMRHPWLYDDNRGWPIFHPMPFVERCEYAADALRARIQSKPHLFRRSPQP